MRAFRRSLALLVLALPASVRAQGTAARWADSARVQVERAWSASDTVALGAARALIDRALVAFPDDAMLLHYQGYALWREGLLHHAAERAAFLEGARASLERSAQRGPIPETHALLSMVYGSEIAADPSRGMELGTKAQAAMADARRLGARNPRVLVLAAESAFYTPEQWGGGLAAAERLLREALPLFADDHPAAPLPAWGESEAHVWLGQVLEKAGKPADAASEYRRALALDPSLAWVSRVLLPRVSSR